MESNLRDLDFERQIQVLNVERTELKFLPPNREVYQKQGNLLFLVPKKDDLLKQKDEEHKKLIEDHAKLFQK